MALCRLLISHIRKSLDLTRNLVNYNASLSFVGLQKVNDVHFCGIRQLANFSGPEQAKKFVNGFEDLPELQSADENVQRIFLLSNASQKEQRKVIESELVKKCNNSQERKTKMTVSIQNLEDHMEKMRNKDKHNKVLLQWLKDQRAKKLKNLRLINFERYVELIKEFNIDPLPSTHSKYAKYKFRRFKIGVEIKEKRSQAVKKMPSLKKRL